MPRSAIEAGVVDIVARPKPCRSASPTTCGTRPSRRNWKPRPVQTDVLSALDQIIILLRDRSGNDFSLYKTNTLYRRIERRMAVHQLATMKDYVRHLRANPQELDLLFKELLIGVTSFFRDAEVWETLRNETLPALLAQPYPAAGLRAWVAACSTGEEAYSLAIVFKEAVEKPCKPRPASAADLRHRPRRRCHRPGAQGLYPATSPPTSRPSAWRATSCRRGRRLPHRQGHPRNGGVRAAERHFRPALHQARHPHLPQPADLLRRGSCRRSCCRCSTTPSTATACCCLAAPRPSAAFGHLFAPLNNKARIFRRLDQALPLAELEFPGRSTPGPAAVEAPKARASAAENLGQLTDQLIQQSWAPAAVLVNADGDILYISGRTGKYLEPAAGKTNINLHAMAREGLREALTGVIRKALKDPQPVTSTACASAPTAAPRSSTWWCRPSTSPKPCAAGC
jgi:two-component system CheB/CheR fusion protein